MISTVRPLVVSHVSLGMKWGGNNCILNPSSHDDGIQYRMALSIP